ncbi:hypothetical protein D908_11498 [Vibrio mimicus CAIM 602]|nr:hypothetical protein D908_11498 [Vibrio mimicus CAIM 602]
MGSHFTCKTHTFIQAKHGVFAWAGRDSDDHLIKHLCSTLNQIQMPVGDGVKSAGVNYPGKTFLAHNPLLINQGSGLILTKSLTFTYEVGMMRTQNFTPYRAQ